MTLLTVNLMFHELLANVNSRYMLSPVRLSVVCNVCAPTQAVEIFGNISTAFGTLAIR